MKETINTETFVDYNFYSRIIEAQRELQHQIEILRRGVVEITEPKQFKFLKND